MRERINKLQSIHQATISLTGKVGIAGLKMSLIAKEAKIAPGTIYIYFTNKEELLNKVYAELKKEGIASVIHEIENLPINVQLYKMWRIAYDYYIINYPKSIFIEQFNFSPLMSEENKKLQERLFLFYHEILDRAKKEGLIKAIDNHLILSLMMGFMKDLSSKVINRQIEISAKMIDTSYVMCWDAIKKCE